LFVVFLTIRDRQPCALLSTSRYIIHASGIDRVGMVSDISGQVIQSGGNVADSAAARLGQYFSLMMLVDLPSNKADDLRQSLSSMNGIDAAVFEAKESSEFVPRVACKFLLLLLVPNWISLLQVFALNTSRMRFLTL
jgi:predicted amino acid-binding ACT domain protein